MANTYKTVIANAIKGFNDIQAKLASYSDLGISAVSTSTTNGVTTVSSSITPSTMVDSIGKMATIKKSDGSFISGKVTYRGNPGGTLKPTIEQNGTTITVTYSKSFSAGYYTSGTLSQTGGTYTIPSGSASFTPSVSQLTYDGTSETALETDILISTAPQSDQLANHYKVVMDPAGTSSVTAGYVTSSNITVNSGTNLVKYIKKGSVTSAISGTNPTFTPTVTFSGSKSDYGITTSKPTSGTDGTNYLTVTPGGSSNSQTFKAGMTLTAGYITVKGTEGTKTVKASAGTATPEYIPIVTPAFDGGSVTAESSQLTVSDTDTDPGTGLLLTAKRSAVLYNGAKKGLINISDNTTARAAGSNKYYVTKISLPAGKTLGSTSADGITINGASGSISKLYAGFASAYGELHLKDTGGSSYKKIANNGKLITATPAYDGGELSGGGLTASSSNVTLGSNNGISVTVSRATVNRSAVEYNGAVDGWVKASDNDDVLPAGSLDATSLTSYITGVTVPKDKTFSVAMTADTSLDTSSNLSITNAAYRNVAVTNATNGTITINGGNVDNGVLIDGANGKTVTVDTTTVTDADGNLITTSVSGTPSVSSSGLTFGTNTSGISVTGGGSASTGTGWISNGSWSNSTTKYVTDITVPKSKKLNSLTLTSGTSDARTYLTSMTVNGLTTVSTLTMTGIIENLVNNNGIITNMGGSNNRITYLKDTTEVSNLGNSTTGATLTVLNNQYGNINIWGASGDRTVQVVSHTVTVDGTTVTNANGDLTTTSRSASTGYVTLTAGAGSVSGTNVSFTTTNNGIKIEGSGSVKGVGYGKVSTGTGWITSGTTESSKSEESSISSNTATKWISGITVPKDVPFSITMTADTTGDTSSNLTVTNAAYRAVSVNGGGANGVLIDGANGKTVKVDNTTVTNAAGKLTTTSLSKSSSGATVTFSTGTGWITESSDSVTISSGTLSTSDATTNNAVPTGYTEDTSIVVPTKGWLLIGDGYYPKTAISLDTILGGKDDGTATAITAGYIRSGYIAYNVDGEKITGTMANWSPSSTYYTTENTGFGSVGSGKYVSSTRYIKAASGWSSSGEVSTAPTVTISKSINSNISTSGTDTYGTGFLIKNSVSESNGSVQTKYSISTAGWTPVKDAVNSGTVTVDPSVTNSFGENYITKLTIPAGKTFGGSSADGVTINGSSGSIGKLYTGFGTSGYGELYLRNGGATSYKKVAANGNLITANPTFTGGELDGGGLTVTNSNVNLSTTNNGILFTVTRADVTRSVVEYSAAVDGWVTKSNGTDILAAGSLDNTKVPNTLTRYITGVTVPKDKTFSVTMTADTALSTSESLTVTNAAYRNVNITTASKGRITINSGSSTVGGATISHKTVSVSNGTANSATTVTNSSGNLITTSVSFAGGAISGSTSASASSSQLTIADTDTDPGSGVLITASASGTAARAAMTYTNTAGWLGAHSGTNAISASGNTAITGSSNKYYATALSLASGKSFAVTNAGTVNVSSNTGIINVTDPSTGTVKYKNWNLKYDSTNDCIDFVFA